LVFLEWSELFLLLPCWSEMLFTPGYYQTYLGPN
jgi:hypothetical protein